MPSCDRRLKTSHISLPKTRIGDDPSSGASGTLFVAQELREERLPGPVRPDNRRVLAGVDREGQTIEDAPVILDDRRIDEFEDGIGLIQASGKVEEVEEVEEVSGKWKVEGGK